MRVWGRPSNPLATVLAVGRAGFLKSLCVALCAFSLGAVAPVARAAPVSQPAAQVRLGSVLRRISPAFMGISVEYNELGSFEAGGALFSRALSLMRPEPSAPMLLRVGGKSADSVYWDTSTAGSPPWVGEIDDHWLSGLVSFVRANDLQVMLDLNLPVHSPTMETALALAADRALGPGRLTALEVGNEPNYYYQQPRLEQEIVRTTVAPPQGWTASYTPLTYWSDFGSYAAALRPPLPSVALAGPEVSSFRRDYLNHTPSPAAGGPAIMTLHRYPGSTCFGRVHDPTQAFMLSQGAVDGRQLRGLTARAHVVGQLLRVTEMNSMSLCGVNPPLAESFTTALWAPDALLEMVKAGVDGVNWHVRATKPNAPFVLGPLGLEARPELYGLALFAQFVRSAVWLVKTRLSAPAGANIKAWAVLTRSGTRVLLINKGPHSFSTLVNAPGAEGPARVEWLLAPSPAAASGVTLGGLSVGDDARWHGRRVASVVHRVGAGFPVTVPRYSAAMLSF